MAHPAFRSKYAAWALARPAFLPRTDAGVGSSSRAASGCCSRQAWASISSSVSQAYFAHSNARSVLLT